MNKLCPAAPATPELTYVPVAASELAWSRETFISHLSRIVISFYMLYKQKTSKKRLERL